MSLQNQKNGNLKQFFNNKYIKNKKDKMELFSHFIYFFYQKVTVTSFEPLSVVPSSKI